MNRFRIKNVNAGLFTCLLYKNAKNKNQFYNQSLSPVQTSPRGNQYPHCEFIIKDDRIFVNFRMNSMRAYNRPIGRIMSTELDCKIRQGRVY